MRYVFALVLSLFVSACAHQHNVTDTDSVGLVRIDAGRNEVSVGDKMVLHETICDQPKNDVKNDSKLNCAGKRIGLATVKEVISESESILELDRGFDIRRVAYVTHENQPNQRRPYLIRERSFERSGN